MPPEQIATGLEREIARPYERPMEAAAGLSSEEVSWSPDGRYVVSGQFPLSPTFFVLPDDLTKLIQL